MPEPPFALDPRVAAGLERQLATWHARLESGAARIGWKIGLNPPSVMAQLGIERPVIGHLTSASMVATGGEHSLTGAANPRVEPEVAIEVADGPDGRPAAGALAAAIELVDLDRPLDDLEQVVAANIFHRAVVLGSPEAERIGEGEAAISRNGEAVHRFDAVGAAGDLEATVALVASTLAAAGERLAAGDRIIAGSLTAQVEVSPGDSVRLEIPGLAPVELHLSPAR